MPRTLPDCSNRPSASALRNSARSKRLVFRSRTAPTASALARAAGSSPASTSATSTSSSARLKSSAPEVRMARRANTRDLSGPLPLPARAARRSSRAPARLPRRARASARGSSMSERRGPRGCSRRLSSARRSASSVAKRSRLRCAAWAEASAAAPASPAPARCRASSEGSPPPDRRERAINSWIPPLDAGSRSWTAASAMRSWATAHPSFPSRTSPACARLSRSSRMPGGSLPRASATNRVGASLPSSDRTAMILVALGPCRSIRAPTARWRPIRAARWAASSAPAVRLRHRPWAFDSTAPWEARARMTSATAKGLESVSLTMTSASFSSATSRDTASAGSGPSSTLEMKQGAVETSRRNSARGPSRAEREQSSHPTGAPQQSPQQAQARGICPLQVIDE